MHNIDKEVLLLLIKLIDDQEKALTGFIKEKDLRLLDGYNRAEVKEILLKELGSRDYIEFISD